MNVGFPNLDQSVDCSTVPVPTGFMEGSVAILRRTEEGQIKIKDKERKSHHSL